eukprot:1140208-Pelagomonas_calceolata.AAC.3
MQAPWPYAGICECCVCAAPTGSVAEVAGAARAFPTCSAAAATTPQGATCMYYVTLYGSVGNLLTAKLTNRSLLEHLMT